MVVQGRGAVVVLDSGDGEDLGARFSPFFPTVVRLNGAQGDSTVKRLVGQMRDHQAYHGIVPASLDPVRLIADFLSEARGHLLDGYPGFVLVVGRPGTTYSRAAVVLDPEEPITTGSLALAAVGFAWRTGVSLDVLMLGGDPQDPPQNWEQASALFSIGERAELLEQALAMGRDAGLQVTWIPLGESARRDDLVLDAVRDGGYDIVLDDLRPIDMGPRFGRLRRVRRALVDEGGTDTAYRLVRDARCDVAIVVDAVNMSLLPANAARAGAVAALSLGLLGIAAPTVGAGGARASTSGDPAVEAPLEVEAPPVAATIAVQAPTATAPAVEAIPEQVTQDQLAGLQGTVDQQQQVLQEQQQDLAVLQQQKAAADAAAAKADTAVADAEAGLAQAQQELADAQTAADDARRGERQEARAAVDVAQAEVDTAQARVETAQESASSASEAAQVAALNVSVQAQTVANFSANIESWSLVVSEAASRADVRVTPTENYQISSTFGQPGVHWSSGFHTGLDFAAPEGTPIFAAADGVVVTAGWGGAFGNYTVIEHADGTTTHYAHQASQAVHVGDQVTAGQQIGTVGSTGNSTGPHLHFEVHSASGERMDPAAWLKS